MIQFTIGCIIIALTVFFGGSTISDNMGFIENREKAYENAERKKKSLESLKSRYELVRKDTMMYSEDLKKNLANQLGISLNEYSFEIQETTDNKVITKNTYTLEGVAQFAKVFKLINNIDKIDGINADFICLKCKLPENSKVKYDPRDESRITFQIKGDIYVYKAEK